MHSRDCTVCEESHAATHYCSMCPHALCGTMANIHTKQKAFKYHDVQLMDQPGLANKVRDKIDLHLQVLNKARTDLFVEFANALPCRRLLGKEDPQAIEHANEVFRVVIEAGVVINRQHKDLLDRRRSLEGLHPLDMWPILADSFLFQTDLWYTDLKRGLSGIHAPERQSLPDPKDVKFSGPLPNCHQEVKMLDIGTGARGDQPGQFDFPSGVSLSHHQEVYVCDAINHRIQVFSIDGKFMRMWDVPQVKVPTDPYKELCTFPVGVVAAPWDDVYVIKKDPKHVYVFHPDGSFRCAWKYTQGDERIHAAYAAGVAVNSYGEVIVMCKSIRVFQPDGTFLRSWSPIDQPEGLCVAPSGNIYVVSQTTCHVYNRHGNELAAWDGLVDAVGVAVSAKGEVFVAEATGVRAFDTRGVFLRKCGLAKGASAVAFGFDRAYICRSDVHAIEIVPQPQKKEVDSKTTGP